VAHIILIKNDYPDHLSLNRTLNYIFRSGIVGGYAVDPNHAYQQMLAVKTAFQKTGGVVLKHFVISFTNNESYQLSPDDALTLAFEVGKTFQYFQLAYALHLDTSKMHLHFILNPVSFVDGRKYSEGIGGFLRVKALLDEWFPKSSNQIKWSDPKSSLNKYSESLDDDFLTIY